MTFPERYGPWAVITGASEGTGASFARQLASQGIRSILVARREGPLAQLKQEICDEYGVECVTASVDLSAVDAAANVVKAVGDREVGLLIANAGADSNGSAFLDAELDAWNQLVHLNVLTTMGLCHHFGRKMRERGRGGMILVGSGACYGGLSGIAVYTGSKAFDQCFSESLWAELKPHGVDVLNLVLGRTDTPAHRELMERLDMPIPAGMASADEVAALGLERLPYGPVQNWGQADDQAGYLSTSAAQRRERVLALSDAAPGQKKS